MALAALATLASATAAAPAIADEIDNVQKLDIAVNGTISQHCAMGSIADVDFGNLERRGLAMEARVAFDCNVPFTMTITGARGALTHTTMPGGQGPYGGALPYEIAVAMAVRHPAVELVSRTFASRQLQGGGVISSNGGIAADDMILAVELGHPSGEAGLLAGNYSETITITVSPT
jgi:spore coat protein U-like protein